jgi:hypothetical protein
LDVSEFENSAQTAKEKLEMIQFNEQLLKSLA